MYYPKITSRFNHHISEAIAVRNKRLRTANPLFLIEGPHLIEMAILAGITLNKVFFTDAFSRNQESQRLLQTASEKAVSLFEITENILHALAETATPQGIIAIAVCNPATLETLSLSSLPFLTVIDGLQDPGNLGTIIRTSDAAGADAVILLPGTCDVFMPKVIRATAGSIFTVPLIAIDADTLFVWLHAKNISLAVTAVDARQSVFETELSVPLALVFGNEAHGVSQKVRQQADMLVKIPIYGKAESLNVSTSAAICLYEAARQKASRFPKEV